MSMISHGWASLSYSYFIRSLLWSIASSAWETLATFSAEKEGNYCGNSGTKQAKVFPDTQTCNWMPLNVSIECPLFLENLVAQSASEAIYLIWLIRRFLAFRPYLWYNFLILFFRRDSLLPNKQIQICTNAWKGFFRKVKKNPYHRLHQRPLPCTERLSCASWRQVSWHNSWIGKLDEHSQMKLLLSSTHLQSPLLCTERLFCASPSREIFQTLLHIRYTNSARYRLN